MEPTAPAHLAVLHYSLFHPPFDEVVPHEFSSSRWSASKRDGAAEIQGTTDSQATEAVWAVSVTLFMGESLGSCPKYTYFYFICNSSNLCCLNHEPPSDSKRIGKYYI